MKTMSKKAIILYGTESTGTRTFTKLFVDGGVFGDYGHSQRMDMLLNTLSYDFSDKDYVIIRRSFPHDGRWDDVIRTKKLLMAKGFNDIKLVITMRDWSCQLYSKQTVYHKEPEPFHIKTPREDIIRASYIQLFKAIIESDLYI